MKMNNSYLFQEIIIKNPVLIGTIGLCPIVAICTSLKSAVIMSVITILTLMVAQALSSLVFRHMAQWVRMGLYMLVGMAIVLPSIIILEMVSPTVMLALGIYLPLLSVNPIIVRQCEREGVKIGFAESLVNSLCAGLGYSLVLVIVGFIREIIGSGTIWGFKVLPGTPAPSFLMPMGGFIILSFLAALLRMYFKKIDPEYAEELAVNSRTSIKKNRNMKSVLIDVDDSTVSEKNTEATVFVADENTVSVAKTAGAVDTEPHVAADAVTAAPTEPVISAPIVLPTGTPSAAETQKPEKPTRRRSKIGKTEKAEKAEATVAEKAPEKVADKAAETAAEKPAATRTRRAAKKTADKPIDAPAKTAVPEKPAETKKPKFEFITLDLPSAADKKTEKKSTSEKSTTPKASADAPVSPRTKKTHETESGVGTSSGGEAAKKNHTQKKSGPTIVYKSDELEKLMSLSLEDIIKGLPETDSKHDGGEESGEK